MADNVPGEISDSTSQARRIDNCGSISCDPCYQDGNKKTAEGFCVECQHYLCEECFQYHCLPKPSRHHKLLGKLEMPRKKVDDSLSEICSHHEGEMIKYYCKTHEIVGCNSCMIIDHKPCVVCTLVDIAKDVEQSTHYKTFCTSIEDVMTGLDDQLNTCKENLTITKSCREKAVSDINELQEKMNLQFESLKQNIVREKENNDIRKIQAVEDSANNIKDTVQNLKEEFQILEETKQSKQLFVALNKSKEKLKMQEQKLKDIKKENKVEKYCFVPNKFLTKMLKSIDETGKLCSQTEHFQKMEKDDHSVTDGRLVILDTISYHVLLFDIQTQTILSKTRLGSCPSDIAVIDQHKFAVTIPEEKKIKIMSIGDEGIIETGNIKVDAGCESLQFAENKLFVTCSRYQKVLIIETTGTNFQKLSVNEDVNIIFSNEIAFFGKSSKKTMYYRNQNSFKACYLSQ